MSPGNPGKEPRPGGRPEAVGPSRLLVQAGVMPAVGGRGMAPVLWSDRACLADIRLRKRTGLCRDETRIRVSVRKVGVSAEGIPSDTLATWYFFRGRWTPLPPHADPHIPSSLWTLWSDPSPTEASPSPAPPCLSLTPSPFPSPSFAQSPPPSPLRPHPAPPYLDWVESPAFALRVLIGFLPR